MTTQPETNRLAVIDTDSGFIKVLAKRLEVAGWQHRVLSTPVQPDELVAMKLNAVVIDIAVLGTDAWDYLERICGMLPELGVIVCTGQSTVAQRVRGLRRQRLRWRQRRRGSRIGRRSCRRERACRGGQRHVVDHAFLQRRFRWLLVEREHQRGGEQDDGGDKTGFRPKTKGARTRWLSRRC